MPATPAWPPKSTPRLFIDEVLAEGAQIPLDGPQAHYLIKVMRVKEGAPIKLFDDRSGEYLAAVTQCGKRDLTLTVGERLREREESPDLWLCAAPIKKDRYHWIAEKATELGVSGFVPIITERTNAPDPKPEKLRAHMIEAAEQCERTALPELTRTLKLDELLSGWPAGRYLLFADERLHDKGEGDMARLLGSLNGPAAILIGPEGGFSDTENAAIRALPQAIPISLGPRILRADTAAIAAVSLWMASCGDWGTSA